MSAISSRMASVVKKASLLAVLVGSLGSLLPVSAAEYVYATAPVSARRWQAAETPTSFAITQDQKLEVVLKKDGWVRVRQAPGPKFGWVPETAVTTTVPANAAPEAPAGGMESLSPEIQEMLQRQLQQQGGGQ